jgi:cobalt-zinc-cadmium efflux system protein
MTSTDSHDHRDGGHAHGHSHAPGSGADKRYLLIALALLAAFMLGELIVAVISGSLALLSDVGAIGGALWAIRLAGRPATRGLDLRLETRRDPLCCR